MRTQDQETNDWAEKILVEKKVALVMHPSGYYRLPLFVNWLPGELDAILLHRGGNVHHESKVLLSSMHYYIISESENV